MSVYEGHGVTLHHGDCLDVLRTLPDASVDSVVTDPPYGLEFMGKDWDAPWQESDVNADAGFHGGGISQTRGLPSFTGTSNPKCLDCKGTRRGRRDGTAKVAVCLCADGGRFPNVRAVEMRAFGEWCEAWATECLRVLKPGGHLLAFGGTRTWHRLACAVEDAGFEVRDSIAWLYGSGFPKSLDVSKAIDKRANVNDETHRRIALVAEVIRTHREAKGMERAEVSRAVVGTPSGACWNWEHHQLPSAEMWPAIKRVLDIPDKFDGLIEGTRAQFIGAEREVLGTKPGTRLAVAPGEDNDRSRTELTVTAAGSEAAARWDGWGTALKPSFEGIVCATKPVPALARIGSRLDELEQSCIPPASGAVPSSAPTHPDSLGARAASAPASAAIRREAAPARTTPTGAAGGSSAATATSASELTGATFWNTVTSWKACWAELCEATSTSTTGTTSSTTTDLETLWSCLSQITPEGTTTDPTSPDGLSSLVGAVDAMFAAAVLNSRATRTLTAIGSATSGTPPTSPAAGGSRAAFEPIVVARKPLTGTVAANVLRYGTGALNIDGCRVGFASESDRASAQALAELRAKGRRMGILGKPGQGDSLSVSQSGDTRTGHEPSATNPAGRWPANVVLDESQAEALDEQSGTLTSGLMRAGTKPKGERETYGQDAAAGYETTRDTPADSGGASRFFYVAKADASERPRVNGTAHPTVKPLDLMRWLVRLVTPPGGTVLEPFAGSGTTVEACIVEGFQCIAIEREADYLPLIRQRIDRRRDPVEALRGQAADLGLFDLLGGEGA